MWLTQFGWKNCPSSIDTACVEVSYAFGVDHLTMYARSAAASASKSNLMPKLVNFVRVFEASLAGQVAS